MNNSYGNESKPTPEKKLADIHQMHRDIGKSSYMLRLVIGLYLVVVFYAWELIQVIISMTKISDNSFMQAFSYTYGTSALLGELKNNLSITAIVLSVILIIRLLPAVACTAIFVKSKKYNAAEEMLPFLTLIQVFGAVEAVIWGISFGYVIFNFIKYKIPLFSFDSGLYSMIIIVFLLLMLFKIIQGVLLPGYSASIKRYISTGKKPEKAYSGIKFCFVMLGTLNAIVFIFIFVSVLVVHGPDAFFRTFRYLWPIYLFFLSYLFCNICAVGITNRYRIRSTSIESGAASASSSMNNRPSNTPYTGPASSQNYNGYQSYNGYQQSGQTYGGYQQNRPGNTTGQGFSGNNAPFSDIPQNRPGNTTGQGFSGNSAPFSDIPPDDFYNSNFYDGQ